MAAKTAAAKASGGWSEVDTGGGAGAADGGGPIVAVKAGTALVLAFFVCFADREADS